MRFEFFIATRYLRAKRRQAFIGIITGISIVGVAAGVASLIVALAINNGFRQDLQERLIGSTSHVSLLRIADDGIRDWLPLLDRLSRQPHVVAAAPAIFEQVLISRGPRARGAVLKGMIPTYERKVGDLLNTVKEGSASCIGRNSSRPRKRSCRDNRLACPERSRRGCPGSASDRRFPGFAGQRSGARGRNAAHHSRQRHGRQPGSNRRLGCARDQPAGRIDAGRHGAEIQPLSGRGNLQLRFFRLRLVVGFYPALRRAAPVRPRRSDFSDRVQGGRHR